MVKNIELNVFNDSIKSNIYYMLFMKCSMFGFSMFGCVIKNMFVPFITTVCICDANTLTHAIWCSRVRTTFARSIVLESLEYRFVLQYSPVFFWIEMPDSALGCEFACFDTLLHNTYHCMGYGRFWRGAYIFSRDEHLFWFILDKYMCENYAYSMLYTASHV